MKSVNVESNVLAALMSTMVHYHTERDGVCVHVCACLGVCGCVCVLATKRGPRFLTNNRGHFWEAGTFCPLNLKGPF